MGCGALKKAGLEKCVDAAEVEAEADETVELDGAGEKNWWPTSGKAVVGVAMEAYLSSSGTYSMSWLT